MNSKIFDVQAGVVSKLNHEQKMDVDLNRRIMEGVESVLVTDDQMKEFVPEEHLSAIKNPSACMDEFLDEPAVSGIKLPWPRAENMIIDYGQLILHSGYDGARKSLLTGFELMHWAAHGDPGLIMSFEMDWMKSLKRLCRQAVGNDNPSRGMKEKFLHWLDEKLYFYDKVGSIPPDDIYRTIIYGAEKLGIKHFLVDSLMTIEIKGGGSDYWHNEGTFCNVLAKLAKDYNVCIHLVAHLNDPDNTGKFPKRFSISGSSKIHKYASTIFIYWVDEDLYEEKQKPEDSQDKARLVYSDGTPKPDMIISCNKSRHAGSLGKRKFNFDVRSLQMIEYKPITYWEQF